MTTQLGQTAKGARLFFFGSIFAVVAYLIFSQVFGLALGYINSLRPAKKIPSTVGFGKLPKPNFQSFKIGEAPVEYELDTVSGGLPEMPAQAPVYPVVAPQSSYLSLDKAKDLARRLNFSVTPQSLSSSNYFWEEENRTLKMNLFSQNFLLDADYTKLVVAVGDFNSQSDVEKAAVAFLTGRGLFHSGYESGFRQVTLAKIENGQIIKTDNIADTSLSQIDFFRSLKDPNDTESPDLPAQAGLPPIVPQVFGVGNIQMLVFVNNKSIEPLKVKYNNWDIDKEGSETYPLKPINLAWQEVVGGNSFVSLVRERAATSLELPDEVSLSKVFIRQIYLAYFDQEDFQKYLQPIFVFEGDARDTEGKIYDFVTYVHAIDPQWVGE